MPEPDAENRLSGLPQHDAVIITPALDCAEAATEVSRGSGLRSHWESLPQAALDLVAGLQPRCVLFDPRTDVAGGFRAVARAVNRRSPVTAVLCLEPIGSGRYVLNLDHSPRPRPLRSVGELLTPRRLHRLTAPDPHRPDTSRRAAVVEPLQVDRWARTVDLHGAPLLLSNAEFDLLNVFGVDAHPCSLAVIAAVVKAESDGHARAVVEALQSKLGDRSSVVSLSPAEEGWWRLTVGTQRAPLVVPAADYVTTSVQAELTVVGPMERGQFDRLNLALQREPERHKAWASRFVFSVGSQDALESALDLLRAEALTHTVELIHHYERPGA